MLSERQSPHEQRTLLLPEQPTVGCSACNTATAGCAAVFPVLGTSCVIATVHLQQQRQPGNRAVVPQSLLLLLVVLHGSSLVPLALAA